MAIPTSLVSQTGAGESEAIVILETTDVRVAYQTTVSGTATYTVQHSLDGINFIDNPDTQAQTVPADGNYILPIAAVRIKVTAGDGTASLIVRQLVV